MLGILELAGKGSGFLRRREAGYLPSNGDVHVGERAIRQFELRAGDEIDKYVKDIISDGPLEMLDEEAQRAINLEKFIETLGRVVARIAAVRRWGNALHGWQKRKGCKGERAINAPSSERGRTPHIAASARSGSSLRNAPRGDGGRCRRPIGFRRLAAFRRLTLPDETARRPRERSARRITQGR